MSMAIQDGQAYKLPMHKRFVIALACLLFGACGEETSPEVEVRRTLDSMEAAAEARDVGDLMQHISSDYRDAHGHSPDELSRYVRGYFIAHPSIHLLTRIERLDFPTPDEARAQVLVAMAGRDADAASAWDLAAEIEQFDVLWVREDGRWKVRYAAWRRRGAPP